MDISKIKASEVGTTFGIKIGEDNAPVKVIEFINLRCPYCRKWHDLSKDVLAKYVADGKIQRIVKHFDKEKPSLQKGNVAHHHIDYSDPQKAVTTIDYLYDHQDDWGDLENSEVANYVEKTLGLADQPNEKEIKGIIAEAEAANIFFVPTVIIGEHIFDEHITTAELTELIEAALSK